MILQALYRLARAEELVGDPDFEVKAIAFLVRVGGDGRLLGIQDTRSVPATEGKGKPRPVAKRFEVPREQARTSGDRAFFGFDKAEYTFGLDPNPEPEKRRPADKLAARFALFRERLAECAAATGDPGVKAVWAALEAVAHGEQAVELPADCAPNDLFAFVWAPDVDRLVTDRPAVRAYWKRLRQPESVETGFLCLVTGEDAGEPGNHPQLKVPGGMSSGVPLVSFNQRAFESHGWKGNENAPVSRAAAEAYATALARLLDPAPADPKNPDQHLGRRNLRLTPDTTVCYWAADLEDPFADCLAGLVEANPESVANLYQGVWKGQPPTLDAEAASAFYALTLTGVQGRVMVRGWFETTVADAARSLARHFADLAMVANTPPPKNQPPRPAMPLRVLLESLAPQGKSEGVPAQLAEELWAAALQGTPYPLGILQRALLRTRAEIGRDSWADSQRRDARAALIRGVLNRRARRLSTSTKEIPAAMDPTNREPGYLLGRLMAVMERLQQIALGDVNASVVDRYFSAASATPRGVFVRLLKGARHHARKALDEPSRKGTAVFLERLMDELASGFDPKKNGFPAALSLEQQGLFVLGYHQQRHELWRSKKSAATEPAPAETPAEAPAEDGEV